MKTIEWAAGLFEGEGNIYKRPNENRFSLNLSMTDKDVIDWFHEVMGVGKRYTRTKGRKKELFVWQVENKADVRLCLEKMVRHFGQRRAYKALNCLDELDNI